MSRAGGWCPRGPRQPAKKACAMLPLLAFISMIISLAIWIVIIGAVLSWLIAFNVINPHNQFVYTVYTGIDRLMEPMLKPIRRMLPDLGGIDISPLVLILALIFVRDVVIAGWIAPIFMVGRASMTGL